MRDDYFVGKWLRDDEADLVTVLDHQRAALVAAPGGLARLMRAVEAVREDRPRGHIAYDAPPSLGI